MTHDPDGLFPDMVPARYGNGRRRGRLILPECLQAAGADQRLAGPDRDRAYQIICKWADLEAKGKLLKRNETALEGEFVNDVFGTALGYTLFSENLPTWQVEPKYSLPYGQADIVLGLFSKGEKRSPRVVVELEGPDKDLDRYRSGGRTPVQQCWDYLAALPPCPWGVVCNIVSFRLYHRDRTPYFYELFTLKNLRDDPAEFRAFYALFSNGGLLPSLLEQRARADELLQRSEEEQQKVGQKLYAEYREERIALIGLLRNPPYGRSLDDAIRIVQKLLDRIVFIAFCEDRDLLPYKALDKTWRQEPAWTHAQNPKWQNFLNLFKSIDKGNERAGITRYNGGLFAHDDDLDGLDLADKHTVFFKEIGTYNFKDTVGVDVLGHFFEQSVTELERLRLDPESVLAPELKSPNGRRKREGIYYTPRLITTYIVERTLGDILRSKFQELAVGLGVDPSREPDPKNRAARIEYEKRRLDVLGTLRVCDPACGSGAFLVQAYECLAGFYEQVIDELCALDGDRHEALHEETSRRILRDNLHGVDLSGEAVEITQLALWLRTAKRGQTLEDLAAQVRVGNSLVEDVKVDPRAFDWRAEFPDIMRDGGFDCIIGNPPYVKLQNFRKDSPLVAAHLVDRYRSARTGNFDMYLPFIERGLELLKPGGRLGFIAPNVWLFNEYGRGLRELVAERRSLHQFVDFKSHQVFDEATTYTAMQFFSTQPADAIETADASHGDLQALSFYTVPYTRLSPEPWALLTDDDQTILEKMRGVSVTLEEASEAIIVGIQTSADAIYHVIRLGPGRYYSHALESEVELDDDLLKPLVSGEDAVPFATPVTDKYLIFPYKITDDECRLLTQTEMKKFKRVWSYLRKFERPLRGREDGKMDQERWYGYVYPKNLDKHELPKIGVPQTVNRLQAFLDLKGAVYFNNVRVNGILPRADKAYSLEYLVTLLNSQALDFAFKRTAKPKDHGYFEANKQFIAPLPIPETKDQKPLAKLAKELADLHAKRLKTSATVHRRFQTDLPPKKLIETSVLPPTLTRKLTEFDTIPRAEVFDEMQKLAQAKFKRTAREDWDEYLTEKTEQLGAIRRQIEDRMADLNDRVYSLFGLSKDQRKRIEDALTPSEPRA